MNTYDMHAERHVDYIKCRFFVSDLNQNCNVPTETSKTREYQFHDKHFRDYRGRDGQIDIT